MSSVGLLNSPLNDSCSASCRPAASPNDFWADYISPGCFLSRILPFAILCARCVKWHPEVRRPIRRNVTAFVNEHGENINAGHTESASFKSVYSPLLFKLWFWQQLRNELFFLPAFPFHLLETRKTVDYKLTRNTGLILLKAFSSQCLNQDIIFLYLCTNIESGAHYWSWLIVFLLSLILLSIESGDLDLVVASESQKKFYSIQFH